jgi:hypothetical protein
MLTPLTGRPAAMQAVAARLLDKSCNHRKARLAAVLVLSCGLAGCLPASVPLRSADPADPAARVPSANYRSAIEPYTSLRPGEPGPWLEQNWRVAPAPKSGQ